MIKVHPKTALVTTIKQELIPSELLLIGKYHKISVLQFEKMRAKLRAQTATLKIYKNSLLKFAFAETEFASLRPFLTGPNCLVRSQTDSFPVFALLHQFKQEFKTLEWQAAVWNGILLDRVKIQLLGQIPNRTVLLQRLLMTLLTPLYHLHLTLQAWQTKRHEAESGS